MSFLGPILLLSLLIFDNLLFPCRLQDVAGYGVGLATRQIYAAAFGERNFSSDLMDLMVQDGRQGKNNGKGYYIYEKGRKPKPDPGVQHVIEEYRKRAKTMPGGKVFIPTLHV
jgi:enoyl-CoA hydratase/3-hydroxyacyl-CoA dehydrogenase